jgi:quinol monooxygenase YgiN
MTPSISEGYGMYIQIKTKGAEGTKAIHELMHSYAPTMFKEEPSMYRKTVLGVNCETTPPMPPQKVTEDRARVIMQWKTKADFAAHSDLPYMGDFKAKQMPHVATNLKDDMIVSHSPCWHAELPGTAGVKCYTLIPMMVFSNLEDATEYYELHKKIGLEQISFEKGGTLRYTIFAPIQIGDSGDYRVYNIAGFKDEAACMAHNVRKDPARMALMEPMGKLMAKMCKTST